MVLEAKSLLRGLNFGVRVSVKVQEYFIRLSQNLFFFSHRMNPLDFMRINLFKVTVGKSVYLITIILRV